jgi:bifunctional non-homologous end joining protein LigD
MPRGKTTQADPPGWLDPELATLTRDRFSDPAWIFERKLDGERCLAYVTGGGQVRLMTRNQHQITSTFPEVAGALAAQATEECVVDGEIVAFDGSETKFERLQQRLGLASPGKDLIASVPVYYYVFDVLHAGGRDVRQLPLTGRKQILRAALAFKDPLRFTEHRDTEGEAFYAEACRDGWEGLIAKRADAPYRSGRTKDWLKFKCESGQEFVIGGFTDPRGSRSGFGALLLGYYNSDGQLVYAGKVGTGFNEKLLHSLHASMVKLVGEVGFSEWTDAGELRHPRFQGVRDDKDPADVVREVPSSGDET